MLGQDKSNRIVDQLIHDPLQQGQTILIHPVTILNKDYQRLDFCQML